MMSEEEQEYYKLPEDHMSYAGKCKYRLDRMLAWVGIPEPEEVEIEGEKIPLREFVYTLLSKKDKISEEDLEIAKKLIQKLEKKKKSDEETLKHAARGEEQTEALCLEIAGLVRAILTLNDIIVEEQCEEIKGKCKQYKIEDWRSWLDYLRQLKS